MFCRFCTHWLLVAALWSLSHSSSLAARRKVTSSKSKSQLDPNVKDWGDYSDLLPGTALGLGLRMMEKQLEDMDQKSLNCRLAERDTFIVTVIQNAMMEGRIQKTTVQGEATVETLDPDTVTKLLHYLELTQDQAFHMLVLKKNLRVSERFPYPVRVEAILEVIDQLPMRKL